MKLFSSGSRKKLVNPNKPVNPVNAKQKKSAGKSKKSAGKKIVLIFLILTFLCAGGFGVWYFYQNTYASFDYDLQPVVILEGSDVTPFEFLTSAEINDDISVDFKESRFVPVAGRQDVPLVLTLGRRSMDASAVLYVLTPASHISFEFATELPPLDPNDFILNKNTAPNDLVDVRFTEIPLLPQDYPVGETFLYLELNGVPFTVNLSVVDTTPPVARAGLVEIKIGEAVTPEKFVSDIFDASFDEDNPPIISFVNEPNVLSKSESDQIVEIKVEDRFGNYDIFNAVLKIRLNNEPPVFEGLGTVNTMVGNPIVFMAGVKAFDSFGRDLEEELGKEIEIINNNVNIYEEGEYTVTYRIEDLTGLYTEETITAFVLSIDPEYVNQRVDEALSEILIDGMTQVEQVRAIHGWVRRSISDSGTRGEPPTLYEAAYRALRDRRGNCYNFFAISSVMLTRAGIPNQQIDRVPGYQYNHRWNLINPDGLGWHHFDTRSPLESINDQLYMFTASQAAQFTRMIADSRVGRVTGYYDYNPALYPPIVE